MSDSASASAAWYPDPEDANQMRYWDGAAWTDFRAPVPRRRSPLWWIIPVVALVLVVAVSSTVNGLINGTDSVAAIHPGMCLDNNPDDYGLGTEVEKVKTVPCGQPHYMEVFYEFRMGDDEAITDPGFEALTEQRCLDNVVAYAPYSDVDADLRLYMFTPVESWDTLVTCLLFRVDRTGAAEQTTGSLKG